MNSKTKKTLLLVVAVLAVVAAVVYYVFFYKPAPLPSNFEMNVYQPIVESLTEDSFRMAGDRQVLAILANDPGFFVEEVKDSSVTLDDLKQLYSGVLTVLDEAGTPGDSIKEIKYEVEGDLVTLICVVRYQSYDVNYEYTFAPNPKAAYNPAVYPYVLSQVVVATQYPMGDLLKRAGMNTLMGMGVVFLALIFIAFIISLFKYMPGSGAKVQAAKEAAKRAEENKAKAVRAVNAPEVTKKEPVPEIAKSEDLMNDKELVAVITAAIYAMNADSKTGNTVPSIPSSDRLIVRSIKRAVR